MSKDKLNPDSWYYLNQRSMNMNPLKIADLTQYVEDNIGLFHKKRIESLNKLKLKTVLKRKNPYLFKAKYLLTAEQIIRKLTNAYISSNEEALFGDWLDCLDTMANFNF